MSDFVPYLQEHQAPETANTGTPLNYSPTDEEKKLVQKVDKMFKRAKIGRASYDQKWLDRYKMFRGKQWEMARPSYRSSEVFNMIFQIIQSQVPILTDTKPKFEFMPKEPSDREFADLMNDIAADDWDRHKFLYKITEMLYDSHIYGTAFSSLNFDPDADNGAGAVCFKPEEIYFIFPDPDGDDVETCDYIVRAESMTLRRVQRKWPKKSQYIKSDIVDILQASKNDLLPIRIQSPTADRVIVEGSGYKWPEEDEKVVVITCYFRDSEITEEEKQGEDGMSFWEQRLKYPRGRKVIVANGIVLEDEPYCYEHGQFPFQRLVNYILPHEFYGISEMEPTEGPQKVFNKLICFALDVLHLTGNPIWVVDTSSGVDTDQLTNAPGLVVEKNPGSEVRREAGVQLQPYVIQLINQIKEWMDQISGAQDITRGVTAPGVTAASAIENLQNAAQTRIRQKSRNMDDFLDHMGEQYAGLVLQYYTAPRVYRVTNKDGTQRYFKAHIETGEDGVRKAVVTRLGDNGLADPKVDEYVLRGKLDLRVSTASALPFSKAAKKDELVQFLQLGLIDAEEVLKGVDYPNWEAVLQRMQDKAAAAAQQQAQQQGQPQQPAA